MVYANWPIESVVGFTPSFSTVRVRWIPTRKLATALGSAIYNTDLWPNGVPEALVWQPKDPAAPETAKARGVRKYEYTDDISHFISAEVRGGPKKEPQTYVWIAWKDTDEPVDAIASRYDLMSDASWICGAVPAEFKMWMSVRSSTQSISAIPVVAAFSQPAPPITRRPSLAAPNTPRSASPPRAPVVSPSDASAPKRRRIVELAERAQFADVSEVERAADTIEALIACGALKYADADADAPSRERAKSVDADMQTMTTAQELVTIAEANARIIAAQQKAVAIAIAHERAAQAAEAYARNVLCQRIYQHLIKSAETSCVEMSQEQLAAETLKAMRS